MSFEPWVASAIPILVRFGLQVLGALAVWVIGRWLIGWVARLVSRVLARHEVDPTLVGYLGTILRVALNVLLVVAILGHFGVETTSFAALVASIGIAIGAAWGGLLTNFAAGAFILILHPFRVGDQVLAGGVDGTVKEIGLVATRINTADHVLTMVGNAKIMGDTIKNYSANRHRRVDRVAQLAHGVDVQDAIARLEAGLAGIPHVVREPAPVVAILDFTPMGTPLAVRPSCDSDHYWDVYFATNLPEQHVVWRQDSGARNPA